MSDLPAVRQVTALFVRADSIYKTMPGVDAWDIERDASNWPGMQPVVAHPPCRLWGQLRQFAKAADPIAERLLAINAVRAVRSFGGVLEHPARSTLWSHCALPVPGRAPDAHSGYSIEVRQCDWGHKAEKRTWLYIVGCHVDDLPPFPPSAEPAGLVKPRRGVPRDGRKIISKPDRERTPEAFAAWLVELARRTSTSGRRLVA